MKNLIQSLVLLTVLAPSAHAALGSYSPEVVCGNGDFEIDSMTYSEQIDRAGNTAMETTYQFVLRNPQIIADFESKGAISKFEVNAKGEFILSQITGGYPCLDNGQECMTDLDNSSLSGDHFTATVNGNDVYLSADQINGGQFPKNTANFNFPNCH